VPQCSQILKANGVTAACAECTETVFLINKIVIATSVVGLVSVVACLAVILAILCGRQLSTRDRIVVGLMWANAIYSSANAIPLLKLHTGLSNCGSIFLSFETIRFGRAWWFFGKVGALSCYQLPVPTRALMYASWSANDPLSLRLL
jgi:hypothetical protein